MDKVIRLEDRGAIPCLHNAAEVHPYQGPPLSPADVLALLGRALARQAQLTLAIDNLRRILCEERVLVDDPVEPPHVLLEEIHRALSLAQSVIPGTHKEALAQVVRTLERLDAYQDQLPPRGLA